MPLTPTFWRRRWGEQKSPPVHASGMSSQRGCIVVKCSACKHPKAVNVSRMEGHAAWDSNGEHWSLTPNTDAVRWVALIARKRPSASTTIARTGGGHKEHG